MSTRERIVEESLRLFNSHGLEQVSIRDIAASLGMSDGNLRYYFRTRDDLVFELFNRLAAKIGSELYFHVSVRPGAGMMKQLLEHLLASFYEYRFIMQDLVAVINKHPRIGRKFARLVKERSVLLTIMISRFVDEGLLVKEPYPGHYERLLENLMILSHCWINGARLFYKGKQQHMVQHYTETIFSLMYPYLTGKTLAAIKKAEKLGKAK